MASRYGDIVFSINSGSSSVKISVYQYFNKTDEPKKLAEAEISNLNGDPVTLKYIRGPTKIKGQVVKGLQNVEDAFNYLLDRFIKDQDLPEFEDINAIKYACHRVVHGGNFKEPHIVDEYCYKELEGIADLAPLHNSGALSIMRVCVKELPKATNVAYFDSSFHQTMPDFIKTYPIDQDVARKNQLRKYGFHGTSYAFMVKEVSKFLGKKPEDLNMIALHLGSGASACAIKNGKCWDTSMGLTPLAGLPGATRTGDIDPSLIFHFTHDVGRPSTSSSKDLHISMAEEILNKQSGWKAMTGTANFGEIALSPEPACQLAFKIMCDRVSGFVGRYFVSLNGKVDALVFAAGIGENCDPLRTAVVEQCSCLGFTIDSKKNLNPADDVVADITPSGNAIKTLICATDEQFEMARDVLVKF
ncbi:MAG: hypothetical protein M1834_000561 [Cirrosporium novae-zelandiae]|nr:MAG: hypothetical protein M1834_000561 [Cirrosporium novae-zelandiae]